MAEKTISLSNLTAYNDNIKATYQAKTDSSLATTSKTVVGAINENKTQLDNITSDLNGYKFVDSPSESEKDLYMQEFDTGIIQTKEDSRINGEDKNLVNVINSTKASIDNHIANHPSGGGSVDHNHTNLNILNTITKENRYVTQEEFDALSESEKNNPNIVWNILTQDEVFGLTLDGNNLNLTKNGVVISTVSLNGIGGGEVVTYGGIVADKTAIDIIEGANSTFTVKLDKSPTNPQIVTLSSSNSDVILTPSDLTFNNSNYDTAQTVTISIAEDDNDYSDESATITISSTNVTSKHITVNVTDNDEPPVIEGAVAGALIQLDATSFNDSTKYWTKTVGSGSIHTGVGTKSGNDVLIPKTKSPLNIEDFSTYPDYTYEAMLKNVWKTNPTATQIPIGSNTPSQGLGVIFRSAGTVECKDFKGGAITSLLNLSNFSSSDYLHIVVTANSHTNKFKLYVNNMPTTEVTLGTLYQNYFVINPNVSNATDVYIRTLRAYPKALNDAEVQQNYDYELSRI